MFSLFLIKNCYSISLPPYLERQNKIKNSFHLAWHGYKKCAQGHDFLKPRSCQGSDWLNLSLTLIDSLDTLYIMNFQNEFDEAVNYLESHFLEHALKNAKGPVFEMIIRVTGGLLSAYQLSGRKILLDIAYNFTSYLVPSFKTKTGLPLPHIDLLNEKQFSWAWHPRSTFLAHAGSLSLELMTLSQETGDNRFKEISDRIYEFFLNNRKQSICGLWPSRINFVTGLFSTFDVSFDAYSDSFYEYLLKTYIITNGCCKGCGTLYQEAIKGMKKILYRNNSKTQNPNYDDQHAYIGSIEQYKPLDNLTYLSFFVPGMVSLGSQYFNSLDLEMAEDIADTYADWHFGTNSGLMADSFFVENHTLFLIDKSYKLRPEFVESCFYLWRFTGDEHWRDIAWNIYISIENFCKTNHGYGELNNVEIPQLGINDIQDSYLLAETFKYLYLIFGDSSEIDLNKYVFTTEAHPLLHLKQSWLNDNYQNVNGYVLINTNEL